MACLNTYNNASFMDPRISFSNDFADATQAAIRQQESNYKEAPASSDFEFSVRNFNIVPADEIFFHGTLVPLKENCKNQLPKMTLREELLVDDDEFEDAALPRQQQKGSGWWKERLGLKRAQMVSKKGDRSEGVMEKIVEEKYPL